MYVAYATGDPTPGSEFSEPTSSPVIKEFGSAQGGWEIDKNPRFVADVSGDGKADIVGFANPGVFVSISTRAGFTQPEYWVLEFGQNLVLQLESEIRRRFDGRDARYIASLLAKLDNANPASELVVAAALLPPCVRIVAARRAALCSSSSPP